MLIEKTMDLDRQNAIETIKKRLANPSLSYSMSFVLMCGSNRCRIVVFSVCFGDKFAAYILSTHFLIYSTINERLMPHDNRWIIHENRFRSIIFFLNSSMVHYSEYEYKMIFDD